MNAVRLDDVKWAADPLQPAAADVNARVREAYY